LLGAGSVGAKSIPIHDQLEPPAAAPEFSVRDRLEPNALLHPHDIPDALVFDRPQFRIVVRRQAAIRGLRTQQALTRARQLVWAQKAANLVGAKRRCLMLPSDGSGCRHGDLSSMLLLYERTDGRSFLQRANIVRFGVRIVSISVLLFVDLYYYAKFTILNFLGQR
jgi:hypothetical protein